MVRSAGNEAAPPSLLTLSTIDGMPLNDAGECIVSEDEVAGQPDRLVWIYADVVCDLFHYGHVEFFQRARAHGDRLVVALVGDADVASYKPRPIMTHSERVAVVRGCKYVDRVLDDPAPLHCTTAFLDGIGAAYCCHGDDMDLSELEFWYAALIGSKRLLTVPYSTGISSRAIVARVVQRAQEGTSGYRVPTAP